MYFHIFCARCTIFFRKILNPNIFKIDRGPEFTTDNYVFVAKRFNIMYRLTGAMSIHPMTKRRFAFLLRPSNARPSPTSHTLSFFSLTPSYFIGGIAPRAFLNNGKNHGVASWVVAFPAKAVT